MAKLNDYWDRLIEEIEPMMQIGESLIKEATPLMEKFQIDLDTENCWEDIPEGFRREFLSCIASKVDGQIEMPLLQELIGSGNLYQSVFEQLERQYSRLEKEDASARVFLQHLMQEVMNVSIMSQAMSLDDWHGIIERRKEAFKVEDVAEYVYKKLCVGLQSQQEIGIYDFFYDKTVQEDINRMLNETKEHLMLASIHRGQTKKRGQGMSRLVVDYIHQWQKQGVMKPLKSIYPFCQCLDRHWNHEINLGTRQGLEATYKQRW